MGFRVEQEVKGKTYVYEVESYWNKEKKQSRQRRVYIGRKDKKTGKIISRNKKLPVGSYNIGSLHFLKGISKKSDLFNIVKKVFPDDYEKILHLAFFKIIKKEPYYLYPLWCQESYTSDKNFITSQGISDFLFDLGRNEKRVEAFFKSWIEENKDVGAVMFDITSISSYGQENEFLERGYNRDSENLEQVNLGVLSKESKQDGPNLPIAYRIYPGSINDVSTLKNIIRLVNEYDIHLKCLVMDKGFYSQRNIRDLSLKGLNYIVPMSFTTKASKEILELLYKKLLSPESSFEFNNEVYSHCKKNIVIGGTKSICHVYLDKERKSFQESKFMKKIFEFEKVFSEKKIKNKEKAQEYFTENIKSGKKFFSLQKNKCYFVLKRNKINIEKELTTMGVVILLTNKKQIDRDEVLSLYRNKDGIEKIFMSFKHDVNEKRNRTHSLIRMRGSLFINFISLILISWIDHVMKTKNLYKKMSKIELYKILDRLKVYELATNEQILGEVSKKQKDIYSAFELSKIEKPSYNF